MLPIYRDFCTGPLPRGGAGKHLGSIRIGSAGNNASTASAAAMRRHLNRLDVAPRQRHPPLAALRYNARMHERFPYERSYWHNEDEQSKKWLDALERTGPENVRARLAQTNAGSAGSVAIGREIDLTIGFAQEWLAWHDRKKAEREVEFRRGQIFWTRWAALAASVAALAAAIGWALTIWAKG